MSELIRAFLAVFPAELPDKSMVATIVLVTRYRRPLAVWAGAAAAFALHVVVAVMAGSLMGLLPDRLVGTAVGLLFAVGAVVLLRSALSARSAEDETEILEGEAVERTFGARSAVVGSFGLIALAEWGDLTQLATASLAARSESPLGTALGAYLALISVAAIGAVAGRQLVTRFSLARVNYVGAAVFAALSVWTFSELLTG